MAEIKVENAVKTFGDFVAVDNVSLTIHDQEFMVLLGPSGCGKTTLLRAIAGLGMVDSGRISIGGRDVTYLPPRSRNISMVFQSYAIFPHMKVYDNVAFGLRMRKVDKNDIDRRVRRASELLHIENMLDRYPSKMSGGQRQRVAVARAIAMQAGKDHAKVTRSTMYQVLTMIRFGRFNEVFEVNNRPNERFDGGMWDFAQGYARLRMGEADFARLYLERVKKAASDTSKADFRGHKVQDLLHVAVGILGGEIYLQTGDLQSAIVSFEGAVAMEDSLRWDEPEPFPFAARHWLGAALLEAKRYADAERVYRKDIEDHPHNGWALFGLLQALEAQGKRDLNAEMDFQESWKRSEVWLRGSRF